MEESLTTNSSMVNNKELTTNNNKGNELVLDCHKTISRTVHNPRSNHTMEESLTTNSSIVINKEHTANIIKMFPKII